MTRLRRFIWYLASRLALLIVLLGLFTVTFYYAMNATNIYIVLKDGMAKRAQVIMMGEDPAELNKFFQSSYLQRDENLLLAIDGQSPYRCYTVRGIDHRLELTWMWCWPWESTARAEFVERVPRIDGRVNRTYTDTAKQLFGDSYESPPKWQAGKYSATLVRENNQWHIKSILLKSAIAETSVTPTPAP
ncbi:MAG: hypothetical protein VB104_05560 [Candidatus Limiplasma sp.]|nr:hypothetical protein [Candidatus Limiplasma sp.]